MAQPGEKQQIYMYNLRDLRVPAVFLLQQVEMERFISRMNRVNY